MYRHASFGRKDIAMFFDDGIICRSTLLCEVPGVCHAFSTRLGGVSTLLHTREMNIAPGHGDPDGTVTQNIDILTRAASGGTLGAADAVLTHQIHSTDVRVIGREERGEGACRAAGAECDGFATAEYGVMPIVRTADCVPILLAGLRDDGTPAVAALHAGWRGSAAGIAAAGVRALEKLGVSPAAVTAAVGAHIGMCCFEVGEDMRDAVRELRGSRFTERYISERSGRLYADLSGMNLEFLCDCGVMQTDVSDECTVCLPEKYHSHRRGHGLRGTMGSCIAIIGSDHR